MEVSDTSDKSDKKKSILIVNTFKLRDRNKEFYFKTSYAGLALYSKLSKNQQRKLNKYGHIPTIPTTDMSLWSYTDKKPKIHKNYNIGRGMMKEGRAGYYIRIAGQLKKVNKLSFLDNPISKTIKEDIGKLFLFSLINQNPLIKGEHKKPKEMV